MPGAWFNRCVTDDLWAIKGAFPAVCITVYRFTCLYINTGWNSHSLGTVLFGQKTVTKVINHSDDLYVHASLIAAFLVPTCLLKKVELLLCFLAVSQKWICPLQLEIIGSYILRYHIDRYSVSYLWYTVWNVPVLKTCLWREYQNDKDYWKYFLYVSDFPRCYNASKVVQHISAHLVLTCK